MPTRLVQCVFVVWLAGFAIPGPCRADDLHVNNVSGDDRFNGRPRALGSENAGAVRSITRALQLVKPGDRVIVEKTDIPYREEISVQGWRLSGNDRLPFQIISNGAILDGTAPVPVGGWEYVGRNVFRFQPELKSHQQLYLNDRPAERITAARSGELPDFQPLQWALRDGWIYFCVERGKSPSSYSLSCCVLQTGITLYEVERVVIAGLVIQGFQLDGVNAHDGVSGAVISRCKLRGNGRSGLSAGGTSRIKVEQSLLGSNVRAQVRSEGLAEIVVEDCRLLESKQTGPGFLQSSGRIQVDDTALR